MHAYPRLAPHSHPPSPRRALRRLGSLAVAVLLAIGLISLPTGAQAAPPGAISLPDPTITGTPRVGVELTASVPGVSPGDADVSFVWKRGDTTVATAASYTPVPGDVDSQLTVTASATKTGYETATSQTTTSEVAKGIFTVSGALNQEAAPKVGASTYCNGCWWSASGGYSDYEHQWVRDGQVVSDSIGRQFENDDAGHILQFRIRITGPGYEDAYLLAPPIGPITGGTITLPQPGISGTHAVGSLLTASVDGMSPSDATVTYSWHRGDTKVGAGATYTPTVEDLGATLKVTAEASKPYFSDASSHNTTHPIGKADFSTRPSASISGTVKVGETLSASAGEVTPEPDGYSYQWYADDEPILDATDADYQLTGAERGKQISVQVTVVKEAHETRSDTSEKTGPVATERAPEVDLSTSRETVRRGQPVTLTWTSREATTVTASGGWSGPLGPNGTQQVTPTRVGPTGYVITATNDNGTVTAQVVVEATSAPASFRTDASNGLRLRGHKIRVTSTGLEPREAYVIRIAGRQVATGKASRTGRVDRRVIIPRQTAQGTQSVTVVGSAPTRLGRDTIRVVANQRPGLSLAFQRLRASDPQTVTVSGLAAGERVRVTYRGKRISPVDARASRAGTWSSTFKVGETWGIRTVKVTGQFKVRSATASFQVVRRCYVGYVCP